MSVFLLLLIGLTLHHQGTSPCLVIIVTLGEYLHYRINTSSSSFTWASNLIKWLPTHFVFSQGCEGYSSLGLERIPRQTRFSICINTSLQEGTGLFYFLEANNHAILLLSLPSNPGGYQKKYFFLWDDSREHWNFHIESKSFNSLYSIQNSTSYACCLINLYFSYRPYEPLARNKRSEADGSHSA